MGHELSSLKGHAAIVFFDYSNASRFRGGQVSRTNRDWTTSAGHQYGNHAVFIQLWFGGVQLSLRGGKGCLLVFHVLDERGVFCIYVRDGCCFCFGHCYSPSIAGWFFGASVSGVSGTSSLVIGAFIINPLARLTGCSTSRP